MKKFNTKKILSLLLISTCVSPLVVEAQPFRAQYEDMEGVPKSLRKSLESGDYYDNGYALEKKKSYIDFSTARSVPSGPVVEEQKVETREIKTISTKQKDMINKYSSHAYSETEVKDARKLGVHALSQDAIVGAAPTMPVRDIEVDREKITTNKEGKSYIVDDDGSKYELRGDKVNIYDGQIIPEGYEIEKKSIKIPTYQLKGLYKGGKQSSLPDDIKKKSSEYLKLGFLKKQNEAQDELHVLPFEPYQLAMEGDDLVFPVSLQGRKRPANRNVVGSSDLTTEKKSSDETRRPANISFNYSDQANYMSAGIPMALTGGENTMESLLAAAYSRNPEINSSREALKAADESIPQAFAGYLPELSASYTTAYNKSGGATGSKQTFHPDSQSLNLSQSIFGGGETYYALEAAKNRVLAARNELRSTEQNFLLEAINSYIDLIFTKKVLILAENNETILNEQLKASRERFIIGDATRTDVAQSEARLANAVSNRVLANGDYINAKSNFKRIFLMDPPEFLPMPTALPEIPETFEECMSVAVARNPEVNRAKFLVDVRENEIDVRKSQLYPQIDLNGAISKREGVSASNLVTTESESITLNFTVPLYSQGTNYSRVREAKDRREQSKYDYQAALNSVRDELVQTWQALTTTASNIEATKASLVASEYALEGVKEEQKEGARTILDVLDAEQERFQSEISHARAIKDSVLAVYRLQSALGGLSPQNLSLPIDVYDPEVHYNQTKNKFFGF